MSDCAKDCADCTCTRDQTAVRESCATCRHVRRWFLHPTTSTWWCFTGGHEIELRDPACDGWAGGGD